MLDQTSFDRKPDCYGIRQITDDEGVEEWEDIRTSPDVAREEANDLMATRRGKIYEVVPLWTTPQPAPATQQAGEKCPSCRNGDLYACTCPFPTSRNATTAQTAESVPAVDERDDFEQVFPLPSGCIRVGTGYASIWYSNWAAHTHCERWQGWQARAARAPAESVQRDAERLDWLEQHSQVNIERVRYLGSDESVYEVTPYNSADYDGKTLRAAIDAAIAAQGGNK